MKKKSKLLFTDHRWDENTIEAMWQACVDVNQRKYGWTYYEPQFEIVSFAQMLDAYSSIGMPIHYNHWSFGKLYEQNYKEYKDGRMGLALELVINTNPCIAYLMETNTALMQFMVIAHANIGHASLFKNNYLFKLNTNPKGIIDYLRYSRDYITECEKKYGPQSVSVLLDCCHALKNYGVDYYKRIRGSKQEVKEARIEALKQHFAERDDDIDKAVGDSYKRIKEQIILENLEEDTQDLFEANILYYIEKNSPVLKTWQREIVRIVRTIEQYFLPQKQTKLINEGWATFVHYTMMQDFYDEGYINEGQYFEFIDFHSRLIAQPAFDSDYYSGFNPYSLGFAIFKDIRRICENPTDEDRQYMPEIAGKNWLEEVTFAMENFKDDSFIEQYLSPKVIRDYKLFSLSEIDQPDQSKVLLDVEQVNDDFGYNEIRKALAASYQLESRMPMLSVDVEMTNNYNNGSIFLKYHNKYGRHLSESTFDDTISYLEALWGDDAVVS